MMGSRIFRRCILISVIAPVIFAGCDITDRFLSTGTPAVQSYQTVSSVLTRTADKNNPQKSPTHSSFLPSPSVHPLEPGKNSPSGQPENPNPQDQCNRATAGIPLDLTIPDNTVLPAGAQFSKTWRIVNNGTCPWSRGYAVVWFSGDELSPVREVYLSRQVDIGKTIDITIDMIAPLNPGIYQSNWKLRSSSGYLFGIGPGGVSPFWVKIEILPGEEKTVISPSPFPTPTVVPYSESTTTLYLRNSFDLDKGVINPLEGFDLRIVIDQKNGVMLSPQNGAKIGIFGTQEPSISDCRLAFLSPEAILLNSEKEKVFYCYITDQGLPGRFIFKKIDTNRGIFELNHLTWYLP